MDKRAILASVYDARGKAQKEKATINWHWMGGQWDEYLRNAGNNWRQTFLPAILGVIAEQGEEWATVLGAEFDIVNIEAAAWFDDYMFKFATPILVTTQDNLAQLLQQAMLEGWSIDAMAKAIGAQFEEWADWRGERIARTETLRASNAGSHHLFKGWDVPMHEWLGTADERIRDTHLDAWAEYSADGGRTGPIPIDQPFLVGGAQLMYPGDPAGPPGETINCRCTELPYNPAWEGM